MFFYLQVMMIQGVWFNLLLAFFNLLPIPPLDGSHVVKHLLPARWALRYQEFGRYGLLVLFLFLSVGRGLLQTWLTPAFTLERMAGAMVAPWVLPADWIS